MVHTWLRDIKRRAGAGALESSRKLTGSVAFSGDLPPVVRCSTSIKQSHNDIVPLMTSVRHLQCGKFQQLPSLSWCTVVTDMQVN